MDEDDNKVFAKGIYYRIYKHINKENVRYITEDELDIFRRENEDYLQQICDRSFNSEYQKIRYFSAILKNSLRDFVPKVEVVEKPKVVVEEHYETKYKPKVRQSLEDLEEDCDE
jgi:hypothetical protein